MSEPERWGHCENCKHWTPPADSSNYSNPEYGTCRMAAGGSGDPMIVESKSFAKDASDYGADLMTKPDFGCNQFVASQAFLDSIGPVLRSPE